MTSACSADVQHACNALPGIEKEIEERNAKTEQLWSEIERIGDDLARNTFQSDLVRQNANTPRNQVALARVAQHSKAIVVEQYCPAKKEFVAHAGLAEFSKRVGLHCKDNPPSATGLGGAQVTLTAQCQGSFASSCP